MTTEWLPGNTAEKSWFSSSLSGYLWGIRRLGLDLHGCMVVQNGTVVSEWYAENREQSVPHELFSACKSLVSLAIGIAIDEKKLKLSDSVIDFFPEKLPAKIPVSLKKLTVRDLLTMSSGQAEETWGKLKQSPDGDWVKTFLALEPTYNPGEQYVYPIFCVFICLLSQKRLDDAA